MIISGTRNKQQLKAKTKPGNTKQLVKLFTKSGRN